MAALKSVPLLLLCLFGGGIAKRTQIDAGGIAAKTVHKHERGATSGEAVIIQVTDRMVYAGFAGEDQPTRSFPSVVGVAKPDDYFAYRDLSVPEQVLVGDEALGAKENWYDLKRPMKQGVVEDWVAMEKLLIHAFEKELRVSPQEHPVILIEQPEPEKDREAWAELMFSRVGVHQFYLGSAAQLASYTAAMDNGVVVYAGDGVTHIVPIYAYNVLLDQVRQVPFGNKNVLDCMTELLPHPRFKGYQSIGKDIIAQAVLDKAGYVALDYDAEKAEEKEVVPEYTLSKELFQCTEGFFPGVSTAVVEAVNACPEDIRGDLYSSVAVTSISSVYPGFAARLAKEIQTKADADDVADLYVEDYESHAAWVGGSIEASLHSMESKWLTRDVYNEQGRAAVQRKFPAI